MLRTSHLISSLNFFKARKEVESGVKTPPLTSLFMIKGRCIKSSLMLTGGVISVDWMRAKSPPDMLTGLMSKKRFHMSSHRHTHTHSPFYNVLPQIVLSCLQDKLASSPPSLACEPLLIMFPTLCHGLLAPRNLMAPSLQGHNGFFNLPNRPEEKRQSLECLP